MGGNRAMEIDPLWFAQVLADTKIYALATFRDHPLMWRDDPAPGPDVGHIYACYRGGSPTVYVPRLITAAEILRRMTLCPEWLSGDPGTEIDPPRLATVLAEISVSAEVGGSIHKRRELESEIDYLGPRIMAESSIGDRIITAISRVNLAELLRALDVYPKWLPYCVPELPRSTAEELRLHYEWDGSETRRHQIGLWFPDEARPPQHPRMLFPRYEWQAVHNAGCGYIRWYAVGNGLGDLSAVEISLAGPAAWAAVASVIRAYIARHRYRKIVIYHDGEPMIEVSGDVSVKQIEALLRTLPGTSESPTEGSKAGKGHEHQAQHRPPGSDPTAQESTSS